MTILHPYIAQFNLGQYLPYPDQFYSKAGSFFLAGTIGGVYGLIGRAISPKAGIIPLHYVAWFTIAYQIKQGFYLLEGRFEKFMAVGAFLDELEKVPEEELHLQDQFRYHCWKVIHLKNAALERLDKFVTKVLHIRPYQEVNCENVKEGSFLEMCRYRIWKVFKTAILDSFSSAAAYYFANGMGFTLPSRTAVPLFIILRSIIVDVFLNPALHLLVKKMGDSDSPSSAYRVYWINRFLPSL